MNLVFIDACSTSATNAWSTPFLYPTAGGVIDRCQIGWRVDTYDIYIQPFNQEFWSSLAAGETAYTARAAGIQACQSSSLGEDALPAGPPSQFIAIWGDQKTKLCSLYTGTDAAYDPQNGDPIWAKVTMPMPQ